MGGGSVGRVGKGTKGKRRRGKKYQSWTIEITQLLQTLLMKESVNCLL